MRDGPGTAHIASGLVFSSTVDVWLGGRATAADVKVAGGRLVGQADQDVPERMDVTLPLEWQGVSLDPAQAGSALGSDGHELALTVHLATLDGQSSWTIRPGRFQVRKWERTGAGVRLTAHGLLQKVADRLRAAPRSPHGASLLSSELARELADVGLHTRIHDGLPGRAMPRDFVFGQDRLKSVLELVRVWPARMRVDGAGVVEFLPPLTGTLGAPVVHLHDGRGGTVVGAPSEGDREGVFNHVIVRVKPEGDAPEWNHEAWVQRGRLNVATYGWVSRVVESRAIRMLSQAQQVAAQELARSQQRARTLPVEAAADWRLELGDVVRVTTSQGVNETGRLTGIDLPLTSTDGVARYDVGVVD